MERPWAVIIKQQEGRREDFSSVDLSYALLSHPIFELMSLSLLPPLTFIIVLNADHLSHSKDFL